MRKGRTGLWLNPYLDAKMMRSMVIKSKSIVLSSTMTIPFYLPNLSKVFIYLSMIVSIHNTKSITDSNDSFKA